jgi:hypothetical protein
MPAMTFVNSFTHSLIEMGFFITKSDPLTGKLIYRDKEDTFRCSVHARWTGGKLRVTERRTYR